MVSKHGRKTQVQEADLGYWKNRDGTARGLAKNWMVRQGAKQPRLALHLGADINRSTLCRWLEDKPLFRLLPTRTAIVKIVERVEVRCLPWNLVLEGDTTPSGEGITPSEGRLFQFHVEHCRMLRNQLAPAEALARMDLLGTLARWAPPALSFSMASNAVFTYGGLLSTRDAAHASRQVLHQAIENIVLLERLAKASKPPRSALHCEHRPVGFAGIGIAFGRFLLAQPDRMHEGFDRLFAAATAPHDEVTDGHWANNARIIERMLEAGTPDAHEWSARTAAVAKANPSEAILLLLRSRDFPLTFAHWEPLIPELFELAFGGKDGIDV